MNKPKHLSQENWDIINKPENSLQRLIFGFSDKGEKSETASHSFEFVDTFNKLKDAKQEESKNPDYKIFPYLFGKYKRGWTVLKVCQKS